MTEQAIQKTITNWLESLGGYVVKTISSNKRGVPDLLVCLDGNFIGIEVKKPTSKTNVSKLQSINISDIQKAGGTAFVATSVADVIKEFKALNIEIKEIQSEVPTTPTYL